MYRCNPSSAPYAMLCHGILTFLYFSVGNVQFSTNWYLSLPIRHTDKLFYSFVPVAILLVDGNIAFLPVYHMTLAFHHSNHVLWDVLEIC